MKTDVLRFENASFGTDLEKVSNLRFYLIEGETMAVMGFANSGKDVLIKHLEKHLGNESMIISYLNEYPYELSVTEYIFLIRKNSHKKLFWNKKLMYKAVRDWLDEFEVDVEPNQLWGELTSVQKRKLELIKAHSLNCKWVLLREDFEGYTLEDYKQLQVLIGTLKKKGMAFLLDTIRLDIVELMADQVILFRNNRIAKKLKRGELIQSDMYYYMTGELADSHKPIEGNRYREDDDTNDFILKIPSFEDLSEQIIQVVGGQIKGIFFRDVQMKEQFYQIVTYQKKGYLMSIKMNKKAIACQHYAQLIQNKIVVMNQIGDGQILIDQLSVEDNLLLPSVKKISNFLGFYDQKAGNVLKGQLSQKGHHLLKNSQNISHEDLVRINLERWYVFHPKLLILYDPFVHIDEQEKAVIIFYLDLFKKNGTAILIITSDFKNCKPLCDDEILVETGMEKERYV